LLDGPWHTQETFLLEAIFFFLSHRG
jgi:hypothetical protein